MVEIAVSSLSMISINITYVPVYFFIFLTRQRVKMIEETPKRNNRMQMNTLVYFLILNETSNQSSESLLLDFYTTCFSSNPFDIV